VEEIEINNGGIVYRIRPSHVAPKDGVRVWMMEYQQDPKHRPGQWDPRGSVHESNGKFEYAGVLYSSPREALEARLLQGP
jgi:hypothetical protein